MRNYTTKEILLQLTLMSLEHQENKGVEAKYLRGMGPLVLVFQKKLGNRSLALGVESKVNKLSKDRKEELMRTIHILR